MYLLPPREVPPYVNSALAGPRRLSLPVCRADADANLPDPEQVGVEAVGTVGVRTPRAVSQLLLRELHQRGGNAARPEHGQARRRHWRPVVR